MKDLFDRLKKSEKEKDMSGSRSKREFQRKIRRKNLGVSLILDLFIFLWILFFVGKAFGWW